MILKENNDKKEIKLQNYLKLSFLCLHDCAIVPDLSAILSTCYDNPAGNVGILTSHVSMKVSRG